ncbi:DNA-3-methyladenine glycosylase I [Natranaerobius trueperi]|uniref:DNA-3-methyladenine glycosylase I n=1 Tax=Natranaerobius trueperi TaxID=759412 RepID=A0A226BZ83_9FIRM|nr:DNA-3-methyladenine glycosylase I [Natranaerobius trueperi]OWZ83509.1 DNA-3-methyladenine glycosylase I [Natranaerobius trueperi]
MVKRCSWCERNQLLIDYHDNEWGIPVHDDQIHFEFIILESFQIGLNWALILSKRDNFRKNFSDFQPQKVALYDEEKVQQLKANKGIIRNERKIRAAIQNAKAFLKIQEQYSSFDSYIWSFVDNTPIINNYETMDEVPAYTPLSKKISQDLKSRGFSMIGPTVMYSYMQAVGILNDHLTTCNWHPKNRL